MPITISCQWADSGNGKEITRVVCSPGVSDDIKEEVKEECLKHNSPDSFFYKDVFVTWGPDYGESSSSIEDTEVIF